MDEQQQASEAAGQKSNLNPLLIVVIVIIVAAVGVMLWLGNNKNSQTASTTQTPTAQQEQQPSAPVATDGADSTATEKTIAVEGGSFYFKPNEIRVKQGEKVKITFTNAGGMHDFVIDELNVKSEMLNGAGSTTVEFTPTKKGTFEFYCSVGNHRQMGMKGNLIVE